MQNSRSRVFKFLRFTCLLLFCMLFSGCLLGIGGDAPRMDIIDELTIEQLNDFYGIYHLDELVCYDETAYYFLRNRKEVCRTSQPGEADVLCTLHIASDIASWGDKLVIYGRTTQEGKNRLIALDKQNPDQSTSLVLDYEKRKQITLSDGTIIEAEASLLPLRFVFHDQTQNISFESLARECIWYKIVDVHPREYWEQALAFFDISIEESYTPSQNLWIAKSEGWLFEFVYSTNHPYLFGLEACYYLNAKNESNDAAYRKNMSELFHYGDQLFLVTNSYMEPIFHKTYEPATLQAVSQPDKSTMQFDVGKEYFLRKRFPSQKNQLQYFVFSSYYVEKIPDVYYQFIQYLSGHKILAIDLETMQQTAELTLSTPREQVLYVNEAGAYTWRQEESRIFFTTWQGESRAVSDVIPYVPRYKTLKDWMEDDVCNIWYAEVDGDGDRLLLFDMTLGQMGLLAVVPLEY